LFIEAPRPRNPTDDAVIEAAKTILAELGLQTSVIKDI
jgi:hypothetical protein